MSPLDLGRMDEPLLGLNELSVRFAGTPPLHPVRHARLALRRGETLALIGESGSGKSMLGLAVAGLLPQGARTDGAVHFDGTDLLLQNGREMAAIRGRGVAFVPQGSGAALNPCLRAVTQVAEVFRRTRGMAKASARLEAHALLARLGLDERAHGLYPHQLSGGMRQRLLIAVGLACRARILIADEPTKGLDSRLVNEIADVFKRARTDDPDLAMLVVTHDLRFAAAIADRVAVMYAGQVLEDGPARAFFGAPRHPYSRALLDAAPERGLTPIPGSAPTPDQTVFGCPFAPRCQRADARCATEPAPLTRIGDTLVACRRHDRT